LGSYGKGRSQLQVINKYDSHCFAGMKWKTYYPILRGFSKAIEDMKWDLFLDESHTGHLISKKVRSVILTELNKKNNNF
jgi:hypothetical protein